jgi:broad specificity phosphatase PhoE
MATSSSENKIFLLILTRHGQTSANKSGIIQGQIDIPLNDEGESEAKRLGHALCNERFTHVYSSDLVRASTVSLIQCCLGTVFSIVSDYQFNHKGMLINMIKHYLYVSVVITLPLSQQTAELASVGRSCSIVTDERLRERVSCT